MPINTENRKLRVVELSDDEWVIFTSMGGQEWLRTRIGRARKGSAVTAIRNRAIIADSATMVDKQLAFKYNLSLSTIGAILRHAKTSTRPRHKKLRQKPSAETRRCDPGIR